MQLFDKDLLSVQEVRGLVSAAKEAQAELAGKTQEEVDRIVKSIADAGVRNAARLAVMANEDTGFGIVADKVVKNVFGSYNVYQAIKDMKTIGVIDRNDEKGLVTIAVPLGVVAGIVPSTNPTSTVFFKSEIAIKSGNAIVFSPHPSALRCIQEAVKVIRQAIAEVGGNENLVSVISIPTRQATETLMTHPDTAMILATGGSAMVHAAYSSGNPAIGVGPGNGPAYLEKTCDLPLAVKRIMDSKTFDNGTICASEQSIICEESYKPAVQAEMEKQGHKVFPISAATKKGISDVLKYTMEVLSNMPEDEDVDDYEMYDSEMMKQSDEIKVIKTEDAYEVEGLKARKLVGSTNFDDYESLQYFQRALIKSGIIRMLEDAGINEGDTVRIYGVEFDFVK